MLNMRIVTTGASVLVFLAIAVGSAAAQTATTGSSGKPLPLLQFFQQKGKAKLRLYASTAAKLAKKTPARTRIAKRATAKTHKSRVEVSRVPAPTATAALSANIWPAPNAATPGGIATPASTPATVSTEPVVNADSNVVGGHTVQVASPNEVNALDLAADNDQHAAKAATPSDPVAPEPVARAMVAAPPAQNPSPPSPVGSASWIAQVLAALGGAVTAGVVAWFLICPAPQRTYG